MSQYFSKILIIIITIVFIAFGVFILQYFQQSNIEELEKEKVLEGGEAEKNLILTSPISEDKWKRGRTYQVRWISNIPKASDVMIRLFKLPIDTFSPVWSSSVLNTGNHSFTVPETLEPGEYGFRIDIYNKEGKRTTKSSDKFFIE